MTRLNGKAFKILNTFIKPENNLLKLAQEVVVKTYLYAHFQLIIHFFYVFRSGLSEKISFSFDKVLIVKSNRNIYVTPLYYKWNQGR